MIIAIGGNTLDDPVILDGRIEKYVDTIFSKLSIWCFNLEEEKNVDFCIFCKTHHHAFKVNSQVNTWAL